MLNFFVLINTQVKIFYRKCINFLIKLQQKLKFYRSAPTFDDYLPRNKFDRKLSKLNNFTKKKFFFVSTDIVDSTRLWNEYTDVMYKYVGRHHRVGSVLIHDLNGYESKKEGDAYFAVFEDAESACEFAKNFMRDLKKRLWIRIGICEGEAMIFRVDNKITFLGDVCTMVDNVCNAADPHEILVCGFNYFPLTLRAKK